MRSWHIEWCCNPRFGVKGTLLCCQGGSSTVCGGKETGGVCLTEKWVKSFCKQSEGVVEAHSPLV